MSQCELLQSRALSPPRILVYKITFLDLMFAICLKDAGEHKFPGE